jgi:hypothetical protein
MGRWGIHLLQCVAAPCDAQYLNTELAGLHKCACAMRLQSLLFAQPSLCGLCDVYTDLQGVQPCVIHAPAEPD